MTRWLLIAVAAGPWLAGCGSNFGLRCEDPQRYAGAAEVAPVRVPEDLSVPDEVGALRIPPLDQTSPRRTTAKEGPCLESPPDYFEGTDAAAAPAAPVAAPSR